jgi:hypothetical protein
MNIRRVSLLRSKVIAGEVARRSVVAEPDAFYTRFFEALLRQGAGRGEASGGGRAIRA